VPLDWRSRLSAADRLGEAPSRRRSNPVDPLQGWTAPEALAAAYAAWYPIDRRVACVRPDPHP
jgi:hypothetical protein